jgi:hypothetical protein
VKTNQSFLVATVLEFLAREERVKWLTEYLETQFPFSFLVLYPFTLQEQK